MKLKDLHLWLFVFLTGVLTGIIFSSHNGFIWLSGAAGFFIVAILIVFVIELFTKSNQFFRIAGFFLFFFIFASAASFIKLQISHNTQKSYSQKIILALDVYYQQHKCYPNTIDKLEIEEQAKRRFLKNQHYLVDSTRHEFSISFNIDGATTYVFNSRDKIWTYKGFDW